MKFALLADVHSNLEALRACLAHATANEAARFAFLGDIVGYGADPRAVVDIVQEYSMRGAVIVKGNHEVALLHRIGQARAFSRVRARAIERLPLWTSWSSATSVDRTTALRQMG